MIELKNITKIYNPGEVTELTLFKNFSLRVDEGEFVSVVGSNGSGKTSFLNILCGTVPVESGKIILGGQDITHMSEYKRYQSIGRVYQNPAFSSCAELTVAENMALADNKGKRFGLGFGLTKSNLDRYRTVLEQTGLGLEDKLYSEAGSLSGGQRQALALVMATLTPIKILILDEHTAALDPNAAEIVMQMTDRVVREKKLTAIMVTHNLRYAVEYGNRLLMFHKGQIELQLDAEAKAKAETKDLLDVFTRISVECGN